MMSTRRATARLAPTHCAVGARRPVTGDAEQVERQSGSEHGGAHPAGHRVLVAGEADQGEHREQREDGQHGVHLQR